MLLACNPPHSLFFSISNWRLENTHIQRERREEEKEEEEMGLGSTPSKAVTLPLFSHPDSGYLVDGVVDISEQREIKRRNGCA